MLENLTVRTGMLLVLGSFVIVLTLANGLGWTNAQRSVAEIRDLNHVAVDQVDPLYQAEAALLRTRLALSSAMTAQRTGAEDQAGQAEQRAMEHLALARERFARYIDVPRSGRDQALAQAVQGSFSEYGAALDALRADVRERLPAKYQEDKAWAQRADTGFAQDMQAFLAWTAERSGGVLASSQRTYSTAQISATALVAIGVLLTVLCWLFIRFSVLRPLRQASGYFDRIAAGDLTTRVHSRSDNEIGCLYAALRRMQEGLTRTVTAVRKGVEEINARAAEIAAGNAHLSVRTEQQASALQETATTMEELAATVKQNAQSAAQANQLVMDSMDVAERGGQSVDRVVSTMQDISASSRKISDIVSVIDGIAFQTNILALNAAVEAARAGEQGKGFAVVAGEVRTLAQRAALAAKEIKALIEASVATVSAGSAQVEAAGRTMQEIVGSVQRVACLMGEISAASAQQASGIDQVGLAIAQMDEVTHQNAALVQEASAAAAAMEDQARRLAEATAVFKTLSGQAIDVTPTARLVPV